jgi:hypothetical protein
MLMLQCRLDLLHILSQVYVFLLQLRALNIQLAELLLTISYLLVYLDHFADGDVGASFLVVCELLRLLVRWVLLPVLHYFLLLIRQVLVRNFDFLQTLIDQDYLLVFGFLLLLGLFSLLGLLVL